MVLSNLKREKMQKVVVVLAILTSIMVPLHPMWKKKKDKIDTEVPMVSMQQELPILPLYLSSLGQAFGLEFNDFLELTVTPYEFRIGDIISLENNAADRMKIPISTHHKNLSIKISDMIFAKDDYLKKCIDNLILNKELNGGFFTTIREDVVNKVKKKKEQESQQLTKTIFSLGYPFLFTASSCVGIYYGIKAFLYDASNKTAGITLISFSATALGFTLFDVSKKLRNGYTIMKKIAFYEQLQTAYNISLDNTGDTEIYTVSNTEET